MYLQLQDKISMPQSPCTFPQLYIRKFPSKCLFNKTNFKLVLLKYRGVKVWNDY